MLKAKDTALIGNDNSGNLGKISASFDVNKGDEILIYEYHWGSAIGGAGATSIALEASVQYVDVRLTSAAEQKILSTVYKPDKNTFTDGDNLDREWKAIFIDSGLHTAEAGVSQYTSFGTHPIWSISDCFHNNEASVVYLKDGKICMNPNTQVYPGISFTAPYSGTLKISVKFSRDNGGNGGGVACMAVVKQGEALIEDGSHNTYIGNDNSGNNGAINTTFDVKKGDTILIYEYHWGDPSATSITVDASAQYTSVLLNAASSDMVIIPCILTAAAAVGFCVVASKKRKKNED